MTKATLSACAVIYGPSSTPGLPLTTCRSYANHAQYAYRKHRGTRLLHFAENIEGHPPRFHLDK